MCPWLHIYCDCIEMHGPAWHKHTLNWHRLTRGDSEPKYASIFTRMHREGCPWDHTASTPRSLSSPPIDYCCVLWLDLTRGDKVLHRLYSYPAHSHSPSPLLPSVLPHRLPSPTKPLSCLPFISFHLSSLLNFTIGIRVWCFDGAAVPQH